MEQESRGEGLGRRLASDGHKTAQASQTISSSCDGISSTAKNQSEDAEKGYCNPAACVKDHPGIWVETELGGGKGTSRDRSQGLPQSSLGPGDGGLDSSGSCKK